ncbi:hypothetical protein AVEN_238830-2-1, partial [Araneus ventricosus]
TAVYLLQKGAILFRLRGFQKPANNILVSLRLNFLQKECPVSMPERFAGGYVMIGSSKSGRTPFLPEALVPTGGYSTTRCLTGQYDGSKSKAGVKTWTSRGKG